MYNIEISSKGVLGCMHHNAKTGRCQPFREKEPVFFVFCGDREKDGFCGNGEKEFCRYSGKKDNRHCREIFQCRNRKKNAEQ